MVEVIRAIILFADIHGSTEFGYSQPIGKYNEMLRDFHKTCHKAIERFRQDNSLEPARVMTTCRGDECCAFLRGGEPSEDERLAMRLAIYLKEMWKQSRFCQLARKAADTGLIPQVDLRIGIGCGKVALDQDVWSGTETLEGIFISEAKRIEGQADAAPETLIMVKWDIQDACTRAGAEVEFGPPIPLRGKGVPPVGETPIYPVKIYPEWKAIQEKLMPSPQTYFQRFDHALALHFSGDLGAAIEEYSELLKLRPDDPAILNSRGNALDDLQRYDEALADYNRSLALRPDDAGTLNNRGVSLRHLKRYEDALADYNRSLELRPDDPQTLNNRAIVVGRLKRYEEALFDFDRSLELRPGHPSPLYNRACTFSLIERYEDALGDLREAIAADVECREMAREDEDFEGLRNDPQWGPKFKELVETEE
jgi:tetratricopeptide (TPR) repeat protein